TSASPILEVASDGSLLYFISNNGIFSLPLSGGTPTPLAPGEASPASLVASGGRLYWANSSDLTIRSVAVGGGAVSTISSAGSAPGSVDVDASNVYWTEPANGAVQFAPLSGGAAVALATGQQDPRGIS